MTVYNVCNSMAEFNLISAPAAAANTTGAQISPNVLEGIILSSGTIFTPTFAQALEFNASVYFYDSGWSGVNEVYWSIIDDVGETTLFDVRSDSSGSSRSLNIRLNGSEVDVSAENLTHGNLHKIDIETLIDDASGYIRVYVDGVLFCEFTGDTNVVGSSGATRMSLNGGYSGTGGGDRTYSAFICGDETVKDMIVVENENKAVGATNTAEAGTITDVDEAGDNQNDVVVFDAADQIFTYTSDLPAEFNTGYEVVAHVHSASSKRSVNGPQNIKMGYNISSTEYLGGNKSLATNFGLAQHIATTNPNTASAWTPAEVDGVEHEIKSAT